MIVEASRHLFAEGGAQAAPPLNARATGIIAALPIVLVHVTAAHTTNASEKDCQLGF